MEEGKPDYQLFQELWDLLSGNEREGVSKEDLSYVLLVVRGVRDVSREVDCEPNENAQGIARFIIYDEDGVI